MNRKYINGVLIVEGSHDVSHVSSLYDTCFITTRGYELPNEELCFLRSLDKDVLVITLTDSDEAGEQIRSKIKEVREEVVDIRIKAPATSKKKGVAECDSKDILEALDKYASDTKFYEDVDLYDLGLIGNKNQKQIKEKVINKFNLGLYNSNNISKHIKLLNVNPQDIKEFVYATSK